MLCHQLARSEVNLLGLGNESANDPPIKTPLPFLGAKPFLMKSWKGAH